MKIFSKEQIDSVHDFSFAQQSIEEGFELYSQGKVIIPPVGHMSFQKPPGNLHIKYGHIPGEEHFVVKIASHFSENSKEGLSSIDGVILLFSQKTGQSIAIFEDHGNLTHIRTGIAGAIAAKYFAPKNVKSIGVIGAGKQARVQLKFLENITPCREVLIWSRDPKQAEEYKRDCSLNHFNISVAEDLDKLTNQCNLIVTTTPSKSPLLLEHQIQKGTHITAVGSDSPGKQELDPLILKKADLVCVDSRSQCKAYGETHHAFLASLIDLSAVSEIGEVIAGKAHKRTSDQQITVVDLTGIAVQDLKIAESMYAALS